MCHELNISSKEFNESIKLVVKIVYGIGSVNNVLCHDIQQEENRRKLPKTDHVDSCSCLTQSLLAS